MVDFVAKPIEPEELWQALIRWIAPRQVPHSTAAPSAVDTDGELVLPVGGLDTTVGLRRVLGKKPLYLALLRKFVDGQGATADEIARALDAGDWRTAERLAHNLKSLAGSIGAGELQVEAANLESAIAAKQSPSVIDARLDSAARILAMLLAELLAKLPARPVDERSALVDPARLQAVCRRLAELLAESDAEASDVLAGEASLLRTAFGGGYRAIETAVNRFDYDAALSALREAARAAGLAA